MALDRLTKIDGGGISTTSDYRVGVITATKFVGPIEGTITSADANFTGNVTIGGTLTYEDVTNIDSVGLGTFRNGIHVKTGTATTALVVEGDGRITGILTVGTSSLKLDGPNNVVNVGTALTLGHSQGVQFHTQNLHSQGFEVNQINASGIITATEADINGDLDVDGHTELDNVNIAGIVTVSSNGINAGILDLKTGNNIRLRFSSGGTAQFRGDTNPIASFDRGSANSTNVKWSYLGADRGLVSSISNEFRLTASGSIPMTFHANSAERLRIESSGAVHTGISTFQDIDVDGHTNLDNVSIAGVTTFTGRSDHSSSLQMLAGNNIVLLNDANSANCQIDCYGGAGFRLTSYNQTMFTCENGNTTKFYTNNGTSRLEITNGGDVQVVTGTLHIPDALQHYGDTDTKIRFPANDTISFETGGVQRLQLDATEAFFNSTGANTDFRVRSPAQGHLFFVDAGNDQVTIKTSSAQSGAVLTVNGRTHLEQLTLGNNSTLDGGAQATIYKPATNTLAFATAGANERLRITSTGKVGLNQSGPYADVDITSSVEDADNGTLAAHGIRLAHVGATDEEVIPITASFRTQQDRARAGIGFISKQASGTDGLAGAIGFYTRNTADGNGLYRTDEKLRITSGGTVNIGGDYTSTTSRLRINSTSYPETTEYLAVFKAGVANGNRFKNRYIKIRNNYTGSVHGGVPIVWEANADGSNNKAYGAVVTEGNGDIRFLNAAATSEKAIGTDLLSTISEKLRITSDGTAKFKGNIEVDTGSAATIDFGDITTAYGRLYADNSNGVLIGSKSNHNLTLRTNNTERIKIANNSAATSIGGSNVFNAMLTVQGDISGELLRLKATEGTSRLMISGTDSNGVEMNLYDDAGGQRGILGVSSGNNEFFIKSPNSSSQLKFYTNDGYGTVWRAQLTKHGIFRAHGFSRSSGTNSQGYNNLRSGYQGDDLSLGPSALYYVGHKNSSSSSNYSAHEVTMYTSGHWGQYQQIIIYAKQHYYHTGYRVWHVDNGGGITLKEDYGGGNMNNTNVSHGGQITVGSGTHGGQNVYKYELTFTNNGTYVQTKWFVGWIGSGGAGHIGNSKTVAQADAHFATNGGGLHFVNVAHESLQASAYYQY